MNAVALGLLGVWFVVVFVVRSIVQKRQTGDSGIRPGAFADDASGIERTAYLLLVVAFVGAIAAPVAAMAGLDPLTDSDLVPVVGLVIAVAGIGATYLAQVGMGSEWRIGIDRTEATGLVTDGVFALVRNPIFTAMIFTAAGFAAMVPNVIAVVAAICLVVAIELQVRYVEEPHLERLHGHAYADYAAQVGRPLHPDPRTHRQGGAAVTVSRFRIDGMDCAAEEQLVRMRLDQLDSIDHVGVDLTTRQVTVEHTGDTAAVAAALAALDLGASHLGDGATPTPRTDPDRERTGLRIALAINAAFFVAELTFGFISRSMGLIADGLDMGADASVYALSLAAVGATTARKNRLARTSGYLQLGLAIIGLIEVLRRVVIDSEPPDTTTMITLAALALAGNIATIVVLHRIKTDEAHLQASWIFTANDIKVNALVITAALAVVLTDSAIPDLAAGAIIFAIVANGARRIIHLAR